MQLRMLRRSSPMPRHVAACICIDVPPVVRVRPRRHSRVRPRLFNDGGFTGNGEWRQAAENADGPPRSPMFINHGIRIPSGAPGRIGGCPPGAPRQRRGEGPGRGEWDGFPGTRRPVAATRVGLPISPAGTAKRCEPRDIPRRSPRIPPFLPKPAISIPPSQCLCKTSLEDVGEGADTRLFRMFKRT